MDKKWVGQKKWKFHHSLHFSKSKSSCPVGLNNSNMFLFTLLLHKWDNPACHLTQSLMHTGLFSFFFAEKRRQAAGMKRFGVVRGKKSAVCGCWIFDNISSSWQEKCNSSFESLRCFSSGSSQSCRTKRWSVLNKKKLVERFYRDSCFSSTHALSLLKMSEKGTDAPNRKLVGTRPDIIFRIISSPPSLLLP